MSRLEGLIPILDAKDINETLLYYTDQLGFAIEFRYNLDPNNYAGVIRDSVRLHFQWQEEKHFLSGRAGNIRVRIYTSDPEKIFLEYESKGVLNPNIHLRNTEWGTREFGFRDINGNGLIFYSDL